MRPGHTMGVALGVQDGFRACGVALEGWVQGMWGGSGGAQGGSRAVGWPWGHRMRPGHVEWAPGVVLGVRVGSWAGGWLLAHRVGSGHLGSSRGKVAAGPVGALGRRGVGVGGGGLGQEPLGSHSAVLGAQDFLGQAFVALGEVIGSQRGRLERALTGVPGKRCGTILLLAEELSNCRDIVTMQLCANKLDKKDFFGKSDPFLVFYRSNEDGTFTICHKTEVVKNTLNPVWQPFTIPVRALCNGDYDRTVKIDVYDWDRDGSHDFIGEFATSYRELSRAQSQFTVYEVLNPRKKCKKKKYVNSGTVTLLSFSVESEFTFVDYIRGGTQLNFTVAIDFTASNGECSLCVLGAPRRRGRGASHGAGADGRCAAGMPSQPTSLHYASPYQLSAYALALKAVGEIIQDYDSDKLFPAYGFGAKLPPDGKISHQFPLVRHWVGGNAGGGGSNRLGCILPWHPAAGGHVPGTAVPLQAPIPVSQNNNVDNPSCAGIEGVLESYLQSLRTVQLYGPTNFAPVINQVAGAAAQVTDGSQYHVLLIITDGVISDMLQTKEAIVTVSAPSFTVSSPHVGCCPGCHPASAPQASALPMSIIIVGVGPAEFEAMEELDGDEVRVSSRGRYAERDIVQVTPAPSPVPPQARDAEPLADLRSRRVVPTGLQTSFPQSLCHFGITWMTRETRC
ncbi:copine-9 isoform 12-T12 [Morphnus guianensis]